MSNTPIKIREMAQSLEARLDNVVDVPYISLPTTVSQLGYTAITNRAQIRDFSADMKPRMGVSRIHVGFLEDAEGEIGNVGQPVKRMKNDLLDQVRFVGDWSEDVTASGFNIRTFGASDNYIEVTFRGTGLNLLTGFINASDRGFDIEVDGVSVGSVVISGSEILNGRNYNQNSVTPIVSGLSEGLHTVRLRVVSSPSTARRVQGFEILNEVTQLTTTPGSSYKGADKRTLATLDTQDYNTGFAVEEGTEVVSPNGRGGHVSVYQDVDGSIKKAIRWTETAQGNLGSADHTNEELIRKYNWMQFGAGRGDDFNSMAETGLHNVAFTLDDGAATLIGNDVNRNGDNLRIAAIGAFITLTFVGTGLDVVLSQDSGATTINDFSVYIDGGSSIGNIPHVNGGDNIFSIVSGLPYGTHTVRIQRDSSGNDPVRFPEFLVYGPKKPTLPAGAVEIGDYFLMADHAEDTSLITSGEDHAPWVNGTVRKHTTREFVFTEGANQTTDWTFQAVTPNIVGGFQAFTDRDNASWEYTFWGTGFDMRFVRAVNGPAAATVELDAHGGSGFQALTSANFGTASFDTRDEDDNTGFFNSSTGILDQNNATTKEARFRTSGLPLGLYTIKVSNSAVGDTLRIEGLDILTPIHTPSFDNEIAKQQIVGASGGGVRDQRILIGKTTLKTRAQQIEDGEIQFDHDFSGAKMTSAQAGFAVSYGRFTPYKTENGVWRLRGTGAGTFNSASVTSVTVDLQGTEIKALEQPFAGYFKGPSATTYPRPTGGASGLNLTSPSQTADGLTFSFNFELDNKPTWAV